ncbi:uncharacterized protein SCODWIG_02326 [Saccharomycodes ludwigii]|uniref:HECT-type E3 ubiquitin transferase n=1 Tax=Saccharomycodes ludwigii TaxID=36035 RepID=A0A376B795_9ASCO|nr:uncharacterized protein SCODWIG_02326 [Saccharomycodes ludwigii]
MQNFTGQSRKRRVNLSTTSRRNRQELIKNASQEREKRALEKKKLISSIKIQSKIRTFLSNKKLAFKIKTNYATLGNTSNLILILFGTRILKYFSLLDLKTIINDIDVGSASFHKCVAKILIKLLNYKEVQQDTEITNIIFGKLGKLATPLSGHDYYTEILKFVLNGDYKDRGPFSKYNEFCNFVNACMSPLLFLRILQLDVEQVVHQRNFTELLHNLDPTMWFTDFPVDEIEELSLAPLVRNIGFEFINCYGNEDGKCDAFFQIYLKVLYKAKNSFKSFCYSKLDTGIFSPSYLSFVSQCRYKILECISQDFAAVFNFLYRFSPDKSTAYSVCLSLIVKPNWMKGLHEACFSDKITSNTSENDTTEKLGDWCSDKISLLIKVLETYLILVTDYELLNPVSATINYPINYFKQVCKFIKETVFKQYRNRIVESTNIFVKNEDTLGNYAEILHKIYIRDTRIKIFPTDFWVIEDADFQENIKIDTLVFQYVEYYRDSAENLFHNVEEQKTSVGLREIKKTHQYYEREKKEIMDKFIQRKKLTREATSKQLMKFYMLYKFPYFIPFMQRVDWFYKLIAKDEYFFDVNQDMPIWPLQNLTGAIANHGRRGRIEATISREHILENAYDAFNSVGELLKDQLALTFTNEVGGIEAGIDGGGLTKEFLTGICEEGFKNRPELFKNNSNNEVYPTEYHDNRMDLNYTFFMGKILGKCLFEHVLIDVSFASFFLNKLLMDDEHLASSTFDELNSLDPELYKNLIKLLSLKSNGKGSGEDIEALGLYFEIDIKDYYGNSKSVELIAGGSGIKVDSKNLFKYILAVADFKLNRQYQASIAYFKNGFNTIIPQHWICIFSAKELQTLISGGIDQKIDIDNLRANTEYGGFTEDDITIKYFWEVLDEFDDEQRSKFVKFITSVPKPPLQGFQSLNPKFGIRNAGYTNRNRLPTASTCVNLLKLPDYRDKELLREKLLYSINSDANFELS